MVIIIWMLVWQMATALKGSLVRNILKSPLKAFQLEICYQLRSSPHPPGNQFWKCLISTFFISPPSEVPREAWLDHLSWIRRLLQSVTENEDAGEDVRWDELQDTLHFIALLSSTGLLLEMFLALSGLTQVGIWTQMTWYSVIGFHLKYLAAFHKCLSRKSVSVYIK